MIFVLALMASAVQLYADFSGCMDIVEGVAELFGIKLDKNFDLPFSSQSTGGVLEKMARYAWCMV